MSTTPITPFQIDGFTVTNVFGELVRLKPCTADGPDRAAAYCDLYWDYDSCRYHVRDTRRHDEALPTECSHGVAVIEHCDACGA